MKYKYKLVQNMSSSIEHHNVNIKYKHNFFILNLTTVEKWKYALSIYLLLENLKNKSNALKFGNCLSIIKSSMIECTVIFWALGTINHQYGLRPYIMILSVRVSIFNQN